MAIACPKCQINYHGTLPAKCLLCGTPFGAVVEPVPAKPVWPKWALWLRERRVEGERGVGDTFERLAAKLGGRAFKAATKAAGWDCGCDHRQDAWNVAYPYRD